MDLYRVGDEFARTAEAIASLDDLHDLLARVSREMGFPYFALTQHVDVLRSEQRAIRLHNYPPDWVAFFDRNALGVSDPVHRASHLTASGFAWSRLPRMIHLTPRDRHVLDSARDQGIGDGFTVPANVPGEACGSCSFAVATGDELPGDRLLLAQWTGTLAFEAARRLSEVRGHDRTRALTDRQRDCVLWAARGKTDWEIGRILGVSEETVARHFKQARARYGVQKRTSLLIRALFDGTISFAEIIWRRYAPFRE
jgi:LuxR family quorum-sensing system transcriptional regulator CciR